jgi:hypothetical protein
VKVSPRRPGEAIRSAVARDGRRMLARVDPDAASLARARPRALGAYAGVEGTTENGVRRFAKVVPGVKQHLVRLGSADRAGALRTSVSKKAARKHPALVTALRRFPDAVLVARKGTKGGERFVLHGPIIRGPANERAYTRFEVDREGRIQASFVHAESGRAMARTRALLSRDWKADPPIARIDERPARTYAVADIHGAVGPLAELLARHGVVADTETKAPRWAGGDALLVVIGDLINKTEGSVATIDYVRALQAEARKAGGEVLVTLGNHEGHFLGDPMGPRSDRPGSINPELTREGVRPEDVAQGRDAAGRGAWLRSLPLAVQAGDMLFLHSGDTNGRSLAKLEQTTRRAVDRHGYRHVLTMGEKPNRGSAVSSAGWESPKALKKNLRNAGPRGEVEGVVYGHAWETLGREEPGGVVALPSGRATNVDSSMFSDEGLPAMVRIERRGRDLVADGLDARGRVERLWSRPAIP